MLCHDDTVAYGMYIDFSFEEKFIYPAHSIRTGKDGKEAEQRGKRNSLAEV